MGNIFFKAFIKSIY